MENSAGAALWEQQWSRLVQVPKQCRLALKNNPRRAIIIGTITIVLSLIWLAAIVWIWFQAMPEGIQIAGLLSAALLLGLFAYHAREILKSKTYPIAELIFGAGLSTWGAVQATDKVAAAIAFIGGLRIITDGYIRFFKHRSVL